MTRMMLILLAASAVSAAAHAEEVRLGITSVKVAEFANMGPDAVEISLDVRGARDFASFTADRIGRQVFVYVDDKLLTAPFIQTEIAGGSLHLTTGADGYGGVGRDEFISMLENAGSIIVSDVER